MGGFGSILIGKWGFLMDFDMEVVDFDRKMGVFDRKMVGFDMKKVGFYVKMCFLDGFSYESGVFG
jgi:hypothetical protein